MYTWTLTSARVRAGLAGMALALLLGLGMALAPGNARAAPTAEESPPPSKRAYTPEPGLLVVRVDPQGPAGAAGVVRGDILWAVDGDPVNTVQELRFLLRTFQPGDTVEVSLRRGDEERSVTVTLGERRGRAYLGILPLDDLRVGRWLARRGRPGPGGPQGPRAFPFPGHPPGRGVRILAVVEAGPAAQAGLEPGERVVAMDGRPVAAPRDLVEALRDKAPGDVVALEVLALDGSSRTVEVTLGAHPDRPGLPYLGLQLRRAHPGVPGLRGSSPRAFPDPLGRSGALNPWGPTARGPARAGGFPLGTR